VYKNEEEKRRKGRRRERGEGEEGQAEEKCRPWREGGVFLRGNGISGTAGGEKVIVRRYRGKKKLLGLRSQGKGKWFTNSLSSEKGLHTLEGSRSEGGGNFMP